MNGPSPDSLEQQRRISEPDISREDDDVPLAIWQHQYQQRERESGKFR
jgi:hypothetical protein